jgi:hypothetical protein
VRVFFSRGCRASQWRDLRSLALVRRWKDHSALPLGADKLRTAKSWPGCDIARQRAEDIKTRGKTCFNSLLATSGSLSNILWNTVEGTEGPARWLKVAARCCIFIDIAPLSSRKLTSCRPPNQIRHLRCRLGERTRRPSPIHSPGHSFLGTCDAAHDHWSSLCYRVRH